MSLADLMRYYNQNPDEQHWSPDDPGGDQPGDSATDYGPIGPSTLFPSQQPADPNDPWVNHTPFTNIAPPSGAPPKASTDGSGGGGGQPTVTTAGNSAGGGGGPGTMTYEQLMQLQQQSTSANADAARAVAAQQQQQFNQELDLRKKQLDFYYTQLQKVGIPAQQLDDWYKHQQAGLAADELNFKKQSYGQSLQEQQRQFNQNQSNWERNFAQSQGNWESQFGLQQGALTGIYNGAKTLAAQQQEANLSGYLSSGDPTLARQAQEFAQGVQQATITGMYNGNPTLAAQNQQFSQGIQANQQRLNEANITGYLDGQTTLGGRQTDAQIAQANAQLTGYLGTQQTLGGQQQGFNQWLAQRNFGEGQRQFNVGQNNQLLQTAAQLRGPQNYFQAADLMRGAAEQQQTPAFLGALQNGQQLPVFAAPGGAPTPVSLGALQEQMGQGQGTQNAQGYYPVQSGRPPVYSQPSGGPYTTQGYGGGYGGGIGGGNVAQTGWYRGGQQGQPIDPGHDFQAQMPAGTNSMGHNKQGQTTYGLPDGREVALDPGEINEFTRDPQGWLQANPNRVGAPQRSAMDLYARGLQQGGGPVSTYGQQAALAAANGSGAVAGQPGLGDQPQHGWRQQQGYQQPVNSAGWRTPADQQAAWNGLSPEMQARYAANGGGLGQQPNSQAMHGSPPQGGYGGYQQQGFQQPLQATNHQAVYSNQSPQHLGGQMLQDPTSQPMAKTGYQSPFQGAGGNGTSGFSAAASGGYGQQGYGGYQQQQRRDQQALAGIGAVGQRGAQALSAGALEQLSPTERGLFQSGLEKSGYSADDFMSQYARSRIGQPGGGFGNARAL